MKSGSFTKYIEGGAPKGGGGFRNRRKLQSTQPSIYPYNIYSHYFHRSIFNNLSRVSATAGSSF